MNPRWQRFAPYFLYLSLIAALVAGGWYFVERQFNLPVQIALAVTIVGLALFALLDPSRVRTAFTGRQFKYGSNFLLLSLAVLGIIVVINFLGVKFNQKWDLTEDKDNTLAPETVQLFSTLPEKVTALAFFSPTTPSDTARSLLTSVQGISNGKFDFRFIDPVADPVSAQSFQITRDGTIIVSTADRNEQVAYVSEEELDIAVIKLMNPGQRVVYFLTGHGEMDIDGTGDESLGNLKQALISKNYTVNTLNLMTNSSIPEGALSIIIAGPKQPISQKETESIKTYLDKGGSVIYLLDPSPVTEFADQIDPLSVYLASDWGITFNNDLILDPNSNPVSLAIANEYGQHTITSKLNRVVSLFPVARSLTLGVPPQGITVTELVKTSQNAWGETDFASLETGNIKLDSGVDLQGPLVISIAAENLTSNARVVSFGNSYFAENKNFYQYANGDLIVNSIDWSAQQDKLINLTPKSNTSRVLIPPQNTWMNLLVLGAIILLPGLIILAGVIVFIRRRRRG